MPRLITRVLLADFWCRMTPHAVDAVLAQIVDLKEDRAPCHEGGCVAVTPVCGGIFARSS